MIRKVKLTEASIKKLNYIDQICFPADGLYPKEGKHWWIAVDSEGLVGFVGMEIIGENTAFIPRVGVFHRASGRGLGRALIRSVEKYCRRNDIPRVVTHTLPDNYKSVNNFTRLGYQLIKPYPWFNYPGALHFRKELC